ncbi:hypothetical protein F5146DRAFT_1145703 [Armillaria mellea]|nr:hypothetical protein F5146DRAFT_1145703 [Armillaria mellea]
MCANNANPPQHVDPRIHADDPQPWDFQICQEDISAMDCQFECIGLVINITIHDGVLNFSDFHHAITQHQVLPDSPKIPSFNSDPEVSYQDSGWCLQQMQTHRGRSTLWCCKKAHKTGTYWSLNTLTNHASMVKAPVNSGIHSNPALKNIFIITPTHGNILHSIDRCYTTDFQPSIDLAKACLPHLCFPTRTMFNLAFLSRMLQQTYQGAEEQCLQLCRGEDPNLIPSMSSDVCSIICPPNSPTNSSPPAPTSAPSSSVSTSTSSALNPLPVLTSTLTSGVRDMRLMQEENHNQDDQGMVVDDGDDKENQAPMMAQPSSLLFVPAHVPQPPPFGPLQWDYPGQNLLGIVKQRVSANQKLHIYTKDVKEAADVFWHVLLHIGSIMHWLPPDQVLDPSLHDEWTPSFIYSADPAMGELMLPWLDLGKMQAVTADPDGEHCLKKPIQQFLMTYCSDILSPHAVGFGQHQATVHENQNRAICAHLMLSNPLFDALAAYHALHKGFQQPFGTQFGLSAWGPILPSVIKDVCDHKNRTGLEFIYWWFDNRLEHVEQLIPHLVYDISPVVNTPQNRLSFAHNPNKSMRHGKQLLLAMMASPYLPANPDKKLVFQFRLLNANVEMNKPTMKSLWSFVHGCFQTVDIRYDGALFKNQLLQAEVSRAMIQLRAQKTTIDSLSHGGDGQFTFTNAQGLATLADAIKCPCCNENM